MLVAQGTLGEAEQLVTQTLATDTRHAHHSARLARAELAAARGDPEASAIAAQALALAEAAGHLDAAAKLRPLLSL